MKAPRALEMALDRSFEGARPRAVLVEDRGFAGRGEREREVAVSSVSVLHECAVDLHSG